MERYISHDIEGDLINMVLHGDKEKVAVEKKEKKADSTTKKATKKTRTLKSKK